MVKSHGERKIVAIARAIASILVKQQKKVDQPLEEY